MATASLTLLQADNVTTHHPLYLQAVSGDTALTYSADDFRELVQALVGRAGRLKDASSLWVSQRLAGANFSVDVWAGAAMVGDGYVVTNYARRNVPLTGFNTSPVATRTHRVLLCVYDKAVSGTAYEARIAVTEDTGSGAPDPSDNPTAILELARFTIASGQTSVADANITMTASRGTLGTTATTFTFSAGFSDATSITGGVVRYWVAGNTVRLQGTVKRTSGDFIAGTGYVIGNLAAQYRPKYPRYLAGVGYVGRTFRLAVGTNGDVTVSSASTGGDLQWVSLDGLSYEID